MVLQLVWSNRAPTRALHFVVNLGSGSICLYLFSMDTIPKPLLVSILCSRSCLFLFTIELATIENGRNTKRERRRLLTHKGVAGLVGEKYSHSAIHRVLSNNWLSCASHNMLFVYETLLCIELIRDCTWTQISARNRALAC